MSDLDFDSLMESTWDEGELPEAPEGFWKAELLRIFRDKEDREDKNGDPYRMVRFMFGLREAESSVDPAEAEEFLGKATAEDAVPFVVFMRRRRDVNGLRRLLKRIGVPEAGTIDETLDSYDGGCMARVHVELSDNFGSQIATVTALGEGEGD